MNPSIVPLPEGWRQHAGEKWLAVFRHITKAPFTSCHGDAHDETNWVLLAVLNRDLRVARPVKLLSTEDFFEDKCDCQKKRTRSTKFEFGPEDPRLYESARSTVTDPHIMMFFNSKATYPNNSILCPAVMGQRMHLAQLGADLRPVWTRPILVPGEDDIDVGTSGLSRTVNYSGRVDAKNEAHGFGVDILNQTEKNWAPFVANITGPDGGDKQPRDLMVYSIEPHVILELRANTARPRVQIGRSWSTSSPQYTAWYEKRNLIETRSKEGWAEIPHASSGPVRFIGKHGQPDVLLSLMHFRWWRGDYSPYPSGCYTFWFYAFEPEPPFRILGHWAWARSICH
jgi:hypothetical protein